MSFESFESGFDHVATDHEKAMNGFAQKMVVPWVTVIKRDKSGKATETELGPTVNQEPSLEELEYMRRLGHRNGELRKAALVRRKELNLGILPAPAYVVQKAICEAWAAVYPRAANSP